jgi:hypothetical protein
MQLDLVQIHVIKNDSITDSNPSGEIIPYMITLSQLEHLRLTNSDILPLESVVIDIINNHP